MNTVLYDPIKARHVIEEFYEDYGAEVCAAKIGRISIPATQKLATKMDIRMSSEAKKQRYYDKHGIDIDAIDAVLAEFFEAEGFKYCWELLKDNNNVTKHIVRVRTKYLELALSKEVKQKIHAEAALTRITPEKKKAIAEASNPDSMEEVEKLALYLPWRKNVRVIGEEMLYD